MDRNTDWGRAECNADGVALRKESVDRNIDGIKERMSGLLSLSARRAWIEIPMSAQRSACGMSSLSARRAWIEM